MKLEVGCKLKCECLILGDRREGWKMGVTKDKLLLGKEFGHLGGAQANIFSLLDEVILQGDRLCCF